MAKRKIIVAEFAVTAYSDGSIDWDRFDEFLRRVLIKARLLGKGLDRSARQRKGM